MVGRGMRAVPVLLVGFAVALAGCSASVSGDAASSAPARGYEDAAEAPPPIGAVAGPVESPGQEVTAVGAIAPALVRTAALELEVGDPPVSVRDVQRAATAAGGYVAEEQSGPSGGLVVIRVPAQALDRLIDDVAALGVVLDRSVTVVDVTEQIVDLDARVASQAASVARVRALLAEATTIGDVVAIESELTRREAELDSLTGRLAALSDQVALSTLTVDLQLDPALAPPEEDSASGFLGGLEAGWVGLMALGAALGTLVGFLLPFVPVLAVLVGVGWLVRRMLRGRRSPTATGNGPRPDVT